MRSASGAVDASSTGSAPYAMVVIRFAEVLRARCRAISGWSATRCVENRLPRRSFSQNHALAGFDHRSRFHSIPSMFITLRLPVSRYRIENAAVL